MHKFMFAVVSLEILFFSSFPKPAICAFGGPIIHELHRISLQSSIPVLDSRGIFVFAEISTSSDGLDITVFGSEGYLFGGSY